MTPSPRAVRTCIACGQSAGQQCGSCKEPYCSRVCQEDNWPTHRQACIDKRAPLRDSRASPGMSLCYCLICSLYLYFISFLREGLSPPLICTGPLLIIPSICSLFLIRCSNFLLSPPAPPPRLFTVPVPVSPLSLPRLEIRRLKVGSTNTLSVCEVTDPGDFAVLYSSEGDLLYGNMETILEQRTPLWRQSPPMHSSMLPSEPSLSAASGHPYGVLGFFEEQFSRAIVIESASTATEDGPN